MAVEKKTVVMESRRLGNTQTPKVFQISAWLAANYYHDFRFCQRLENQVMVSKFLKEPICVYWCPSAAGCAKKERRMFVFHPCTHI